MRAELIRVLICVSKERAECVRREKRAEKEGKEEKKEGQESSVLYGSCRNFRDCVL